MSDDFFDAVPDVRSAGGTGNAIELHRGETPAVQTARILFESGLFPNAQNVGGVFTIVQYGREVGLSPVVSLNNVAIIKGKLSMSGASMLALAMKHGVKATVEEETNEVCSILFERDGFQPYRSTFTIEDADHAELLKQEDGKIKHEGWRKYPSQMLRWRAVSKGLKVVAPDILAGVYTEEEIEGIEVAQNNTQQARALAESSAQNNTQALSAGNVSEKQSPQAGKLTTGQSKTLHAIMAERGVTPFRESFKKFLLEFDGNGMDHAAPSAKDLNKEFCSDLIGKFRVYAAQFFASKKYREEVVSTFNGMSVQQRVGFLCAFKTLLNDAEFFTISAEEKDEKRIADFFRLVLTGLENQEHNRIAAIANEGKSISVEEAVDTLKELGMDPKVVTGTKITGQQVMSSKPPDDILGF